MAAVLNHQRFELSPESRGMPHTSTHPLDHPILTDLQTFDDLTRYSISKTKMEALWRIECDRLVKGLTDNEANLLFPAMDLGDASPHGYLVVQALADEVDFNFLICTLDNATLLLDKIPSLHDRNSFDSARGRLLRRTAIIEEEAKNTKPQPQFLQEPEKRAAMFALIDYITLVIAKVLVPCASSDHWVRTCIGVLAKFSAKLKGLSAETPRFAAISLQAAEVKAMSIVIAENRDKSKHRLPINETFDTSEDSVRGLFYAQEAIFRKAVCGTFSTVLGALQGRRYTTGAPITSFEVCSVVYETGLGGFKTLVFQERDGDLQATSCTQILPIARSAFENMLRTVIELKKLEKPPLPSDEQRTRLKWQVVIADGEPCNNIRSSHLGATAPKGPGSDIPAVSSDHELCLINVEDFISVMVPLTMTSPAILTDIPELINISHLMSEFHNVQTVLLPAAFGRFKADFCLFTDRYATPDSEPTTSSLSQGLMRRDRLLRGSLEGVIKWGQTSANLIAEQGKSRDEVNAHIANANKVMGEWIYEEKAVITKCEAYVWAIISIALLLVIGGLVVGFTVGSRIKGVDPFNVTTYCWVLAAFVTLVGKSIRVETWSWRDFLLRRVRCRSVSELQAVTRVPHHLILAKLLDDEPNNILNTHGPFHAPFRRKSEDGFSIDRPIPIWTMLLSGLIMVKVNTERGAALICLDCRRGTRLTTVTHSQLIATKRLVCDSIPQDNEEAKAPRLQLKYKEIQWRAVLGLYNKGNASFV